MVTFRAVGSGRGTDQDLFNIDGESPVIATVTSQRGAFGMPPPSARVAITERDDETGRGGVVVTN